MEAVIKHHNFKASLSLNEVLARFFDDRTPESTNLLFWKFFQCWVTKECNIKADLSDQEVALFFDQLMDLVAAAYIVHQANGASETEQKGKSHD
ncbi:hypothetical protein D0C36_19375 [Mucilaginibacter conchicola]|uniref:Uncharacterized protein n=1 Tax=Mucilaginibacter conchicola TaxID=2303333 RepID=A0A372NRX6_9SPHI|nr:hypothetical protein [Mucilaginibacter conchicola]RFZ91105.1 hypothetical protein D0C36_19375 [Mucilaginibacter conchicola]